ncbi:MAG TPA: acyltransferase [Acidisarcina sp.]
MPAKQSFYIPCLDGIRALAVMMVIVAHSGFEYLAPGGLGVTIFFFLSGFLITTLLRIEAMTSGTISIRDFYLRRVYRILPPLYVTIAFVCVCAALHILEGPLDWAAIGLTCVFVTNYLPMLHVGIPTGGLENLWSLAVEEHFYLVFPIAYFLLISRKVRRLWQSVAMAAACLLVLLWRIYLIYYLHRPTGDSGRVYLYTDTRIDSILFGSLMAVAINPLLDSLPRFLRDNVGKFALCGVALLAFTVAYRDELFRDTYRYSLQGVALGLIFLFVVSSPERWQARWLENPVLKYLGRRSYVLYLIHFAIARELFFDLRMSKFVTLPVSFALSLAFAEIMNRLVEEPMRRVKKRAMHSPFHASVSTPEDATQPVESIAGAPPTAGAA